MSIEKRVQQYATIFEDWKFDKLVGTGSGGKTAVYRLTRFNGWKEESALKVIPIIEENGNLQQFSDSFQKDYESKKEQSYQKALEEVRFMYEVRETPYVVRYFDYKFNDWEEDNCFGCDLLIRMELLDNLREQIKCKENYTEPEIIQIGKDICKALIACHKKDIIHRDIKPENIFINSEGTYKLGDFGISRIVSCSQSASTKTGSPPYAAPEQFECNYKTYDYRVDIYSLGLVLYELSNENRLPFATSTYVKEEDIILRSRGKPIEKPCNASPIFAKVILKACAYEPEQRYQSPEEFLTALKTVEKIQLELEEELRKNKQELKTNENINIYNTMSASENIFKQEEQNQQYETIPASGDICEKNEQNTKYETVPARASKKEKKEKENRIEELREKAEQGNAEAQNKLGDCYCYGQGVKKNYQEAIKWYQKSAEYGNANAQLRLGCFYYYGIGVEKDYKKAVEWYKKLVEQGNIEVIKKVADYYYNKQEYQEAVIWLKKLVEQDDAEALEKLGNCYYNGYGVKKDIIKGMGLRLKARKNKKKEIKIEI